MPLEQETILMKIDYQTLFNKAQVDYSHLEEIVDRAFFIRMNRARYDKVAAIAKVPWYVVGAIHSLECNCNFECHLHNGDPLTARTVHVPKGRPIAGNPPFTWEESAVDALGDIPQGLP